MTKPVSSYHDLSVSERIQLVEDIWDSIANESAPALELSSADTAETQRRLAAHQAAPASAVAWDAVRDSLFRPR